MARSTGPILAIGAVTAGNQIAHGTVPTWRLPLATGLAALVFTAAEHVNQPIVTALAWAALATTLLIPQKGLPAPLTTLSTIAKGSP